MIIEEQSAEQNQNDFEVEDLFIKENNNILEINKNMITEFMAPLKSAPSDIEKVIEETRKNYRKKRKSSQQRKSKKRRTKLTILKNGLFSDSQYYLQDIFIPGNKSALLKKQYYVGIFNAHFENYQVHLLVESFQTLVGEEWLDDDVVNAVACSIEKSWLWATFIPTTHSNLLFADKWEVEPSKDWPMFTRDFGIKHLIMIPYVHNGHWRIFMINLKKYTFTVIDPYDKKKKELMYEINWVQNRFERFLELCKKLGFRQSWTSVQWTIEFFEKRDRPFQASTDGSNCGIVSCQHKGDRRNEYDDSDNDSASSSSQSSISRGFSPPMSPIPS
uniref:Ubiquitin-like protease family profile domain-containing protein n=1 Tax=Trichogramma kaykai TaxID=54128 RepID=A0ABD2WPG3_9HYME